MCIEEYNKIVRELEERGYYILYKEGVEEALIEGKDFIIINLSNEELDDEEEYAVDSIEEAIIFLDICLSYLKLGRRIEETIDDERLWVK